MQPERKNEKENQRNCAQRKNQRQQCSILMDAVPTSKRPFDAMQRSMPCNRMSADTSVQPLIIGAGIAGLTLGIALRDRGIEAEICEAAPELRPLGAGIWMAPNAMQIFGRLGLAQPIIDAGAEVERVALLDSRLHEISSSSLATVREKFGFTIAAIQRAELHRILLDRFGNRSLRLGKRLASIENHLAAPTAVFEDGTAASAPCLIGADGIHSAARHLIRPSALPRRTGQLCWSGLTEFDLPWEFRRSTVEIWGGRSRMGIADVGHGRAYWFLVSSGVDVARPRPSDCIAELLEIVKDYDGPSRDLIRATPVSAVSEVELTDLRPRLPWSAGNICLIGDAAHPTTPNLGQGGAQAVEDAWTLARCLAEYREPAQAFHAFETARFKKVKTVSGIAEIARPTPMGHEYCGIVEEVGKEVRKIKPGQFVVGSFATSDNTCVICQDGYQSSCLQREFMSAAQAALLRVPLADGTLVATRDLPSKELIPGLLATSDVLGTGWFAAHAASVKPGRTVVVVGDGAVGLLGVLSARQMGAERIIAMSRHEARQKLAREFGATDIVTERGDEGIARIKDLTKGIGADSVLECVGTQESMMQAIRSARPGGFVSYVGVPHGVDLDGAGLFFAHVHLHGGPAPVRRFLPELIDLVLNEKIDPAKVFDLTLPLDQVAEGYRAMDERRAIKTLLRT